LIFASLALNAVGDLVEIPDAGTAALAAVTLPLIGWPA
jgi:hypothetical protein